MPLCGERRGKNSTANAAIKGAHRQAQEIYIVLSYLTIQPYECAILYNVAQIWGNIVPITLLLGFVSHVVLKQPPNYL